MGVAVLPPPDFLRNHHHHHTHRQFISPANKPRRNPSPNPNPNPNSNRSNRRRRNSPPPPPAGGPARSASLPMMGQIRILKRGEDLCLPEKPTRPVNPARPGNGLMPEGFYAGSAFVTSPPPSSLPFPAFFAARRNCGTSESCRDPVAESVLRRALKLQ